MCVCVCGCEWKQVSGPSETILGSSQEAPNTTNNRFQHFTFVVDDYDHSCSKYNVASLCLSVSVSSTTARGKNQTEFQTQSNKYFGIKLISIDFGVRGYKYLCAGGGGGGLGSN